jgi:hypothetical protein
VLARREPAEKKINCPAREISGSHLICFFNVFIKVTIRQKMKIYYRIIKTLIGLLFVHEEILLAINAAELLLSASVKSLYKIIRGDDGHWRSWPKNIKLNCQTCLGKPSACDPNVTVLIRRDVLSILNKKGGRLSPSFPGNDCGNLNPRMGE